MISRRHLLLAAAAGGCVKATPPAPDLRAFTADLPWETANGVAFEPWRLEGRVVLLTFLATWCFPCLAELVVLKRLARDHGEGGFSNVLIGMDLEGKKVLEPFAQGYQLTEPVLVSTPRLRNGETLFGRIRELPSRMLFGRDGRLVVAWSGVSGFAELDQLVRAELAKK